MRLRCVVRLRFTLELALVAACVAGPSSVVHAQSVVPAVPSCRQAVDEHGRALPPDAVRWTLREPAGERERLDRQCGAVGPVVWDPQPSRLLPAASSAGIAIVSWNVHVGRGDLAGFVRQLESGAITGAPVRDYVLLIQEAYRAGSSLPARPRFRVPRRIVRRPGPQSREDIVGVARTLGLAVFYVPSMRNGSDNPPEDRGNAILSTRALARASAIELPFTRQRRIAVAADLDSGRRSFLRAAVLHLDALAGPSRLWIFASGWRGHQARAALETIDPARDAVLGADLNTWIGGRWESAYRRAHAAFPSPLAPQPGTGDGTHGRLDYLLFKQNAAVPPTVRRLKGKYGSDHRPIVAWLGSSP